MTTITITPDLIERLGDFSQRIEFRDRQGRLVGEYHPIGRSQEYVNPIDGSPCSEDEVRMLAEEPRGPQRTPPGRYFARPRSAGMSFRVFWTVRSDNDLADIWLSAADRDAVTESSERINRILRTQGAAAGESREGKLRILIDDPLACYFRHNQTGQELAVV